MRFSSLYDVQKRSVLMNVTRESLIIRFVRTGTYIEFSPESKGYLYLQQAVPGLKTNNKKVDNAVILAHVGTC